MPQVWPNGYREAHTGWDLHSLIIVYCTCFQLHSTTINTHSLNINHIWEWVPSNALGFILWEVFWDDVRRCKSGHGFFSSGILRVSIAPTWISGLIGKAASGLFAFWIVFKYGDLNKAHPRPGWTCRKSLHINKINVDYHSFLMRRQHRVPKWKPAWWGVFDFGAFLLFLTYKAAAWASFMLSRHVLCTYFWQFFWSSRIFESPTWLGSRNKEIRLFEKWKSGFLVNICPMMAFFDPQWLFLPLIGSELCSIKKCTVETFMGAHFGAIHRPSEADNAPITVLKNLIFGGQFLPYFQDSSVEFLRAGTK